MLVLPHADVVLHALCTVARNKSVHPFEIVRHCIARPALMHWLTRRTVSLNYQSMQALIACLTSDHNVQFNGHDGYHINGGPFVLAHDRPIPDFPRFPYHGVPKANPSAA